MKDNTVMIVKNGSAEICGDCREAFTAGKVTEPTGRDRAAIQETEQRNFGLSAQLIRFLTKYVNKLRFAR